MRIWIDLKCCSGTVSLRCVQNGVMTRVWISKRWWWRNVSLTRHCLLCQHANKCRTRTVCISNLNRSAFDFNKARDTSSSLCCHHLYSTSEFIPRVINLCYYTNQWITIFSLIINSLLPKSVACGFLNHLNRDTNLRFFSLVSFIDNLHVSLGPYCSDVGRWTPRANTTLCLSEASLRIIARIFFQLWWIFHDGWNFMGFFFIFIFTGTFLQGVQQPLFDAQFGKQFVCFII